MITMAPLSPMPCYYPNQLIHTMHSLANNTHINQQPGLKYIRGFVADAGNLHFFFHFRTQHSLLLALMVDWLVEKFMILT
jgi:hypothetical protein